MGGRVFGRAGLSLYIHLYLRFIGTFGGFPTEKGRPSGHSTDFIHHFLAEGNKPTRKSWRRERKRKSKRFRFGDFFGFLEGGSVVSVFFFSLRSILEKVRKYGDFCVPRYKLWKFSIVGSESSSVSQKYYFFF